MTYPRLKPCLKCGSDQVIIWTYESGWTRTECEDCNEISSCEQTKLGAIREHNRRAAEAAAAPK